MLLILTSPIWASLIAVGGTLFIIGALIAGFLGAAILKDKLSRMVKVSFDKAVEETIEDISK